VWTGCTCFKSEAGLSVLFAILGSSFSMTKGWLSEFEIVCLGKRRKDEMSCKLMRDFRSWMVRVLNDG
jgi:hypothetical protein